MMAGDRDHESQRKFLCECLDMCTSGNRPCSSETAQVFVQMLGYVHVGQPTVIMRVSARVFRANAWTCPRRATDRDLQSVFPREKVNAWICPRQATDRDLESVSAMIRANAWICAPPTTGHDPANAIFYLKTVTPVTPVTSVISCGQEFFRIIIKL